MEFLLHEPKTITNWSVDGGRSNKGMKPRRIQRVLMELGVSWGVLESDRWGLITWRGKRDQQRCII